MIMKKKKKNDGYGPHRTYHMHELLDYVIARLCLA